ncbi:MAG: TlpA family protein disulfide reductase [Planctomycetes bacterium]|nr:TlpA family protein disulfide reductase [Planctomycetota bacterium]
MKKLLLLALVAGCSSSPTRDQAPSFQLSGLDGKSVRAEDLWSGRPVLLVFMTSWCKACKAEVPRLNEISKTHAVVAISTGDSKEAVERCRSEAGITYPILLDEGAVAKAYGVQASPTIVLIDKGGAVRYRGHVPPEELK